MLDFVRISSVKPVRILRISCLDLHEILAWNRPTTSKINAHQIFSDNSAVDFDSLSCLPHFGTHHLPGHKENYAKTENEHGHCILMRLKIFKEFLLCLGISGL